MKEVRFANKDLLWAINENACKADFNRVIDWEFLSELPDDETLYPVTFSMLHNDTEIRTSFFTPEGSISVDMTPEQWLLLPSLSEEEL
ncbi:MAG: hypothetical protein CME21_21540 [Gemmatimonadetes bacterium]|nr:hypothetical protein [Gemmatimonadota bacterium]|tara:strand:- start:180 stop:443 length:264 start_codon:yes stop_codon:yes gene_type:complete